MRLKTRKKRRGADASRWVWVAALSLGGAVPEAVASELAPAFPGVWAAAIALSLTLIMAVKGSQR